MSKENALELLIKSAEAAIAYDRAIQGCANDPDKMSSYCTAQGDDLDTLYFNWIQAARAALIAAKVSPAAANKATEEGELPALPLSKSEYGFDHTLSFCAADMYEYARRAIAADRASRQVANKEEVEPVGVIVADDPVHGWYMHALKPWNEIGAGTKLYATPPATTGASTVLTDERIAAIWHETACAEGEGTREHPAVFARAIEREVAAQAGQVAVPDDLARDAARFRWLEERFTGFDFYWMGTPPYEAEEDKGKCVIVFECGQDFEAGRHFQREIDKKIGLAAAPSPAKESK